MLMQRIFLDWQKSIITSTVEWLWGKREQLSTMLIVVPTSQSARRLREALMLRAHREDAAIFGLRMVTPSYFLKSDDKSIAGEDIECIAWIEVLESIDDWSLYAGAFPIAPDVDESPGWAMGLAQSLLSLRRDLQEGGLRIKDAMKRMQKSIDGERWVALSLLEEKVEALLRSWSYQNRSSFLASYRAPLPDGCTSLVIAGVTDAVPLVTKRWMEMDNATVLIAAPESAADFFDEVGRPLPQWNEKMLDFPGKNQVIGSVTTAADARDLAMQAVKIVAEHGQPSDQVVLAACEPALGNPLKQSFSRYGWSLFDPAANAISLGHATWLHHWRRWLAKPRLAVLAEIAAFRETQAIVGQDHSQQWIRALGLIRDQWLADSLEDVQRIANHPEMRAPEGTMQLIEVISCLLSLRSEFRTQGLSQGIKSITDLWQRANIFDEAEKIQLTQDAARWDHLVPKIKRGTDFWLELFCLNLSSHALELPEDRVLDVQGWLEIPYDASPHLVICGMNDHCIPARSGGEPWLGENARKLLGLITDEQRAARDAYLFHSMMMARSADGRIDIICRKVDDDGKILQPSRLLLRAQGDDLAERVVKLFSEIEPSDAHVTWQQDWTWTPRLIDVGREKDDHRLLSVTSLKDYLECPYRFYLKHPLKMNQLDGDRAEWDNRNFGTIMHEVLEQWGRDPIAKDLTQVKELTNCLSDLLSDLVKRWYGNSPGLAITIQAASLQQRFAWFAEVQVAHRQTGWQIHDVEKAFELPMNHFVINGKIDRIDHHPETDAWMMWDYKSGSLESKVASSHLKKITNNTVLPAHLCDDHRLCYAPDEKTTMRWTNLQLPLYSAAGLTPSMAGVGYIAMGDAKDKVKFDTWENFQKSTIDSAKDCAQLLLDRIAAKIFWPPNEKVTFENFALLAAGAELSATSREPAILENS